MTISHGFLEGFLDPDQIKPIAKKINNFLDNQSEESNYYSNIRDFLPEVDLIINQKIKSKISELLDTNNPFLSSIELHVQLPKCDPIPPHQDNFYHCIYPPNYGLKILVPLSNLNSLMGGLSYLDIPIDYPIMEHIPSDTPNFSSIIPIEDFKKINKKISSYDYFLGDISFHFLNSIHLSFGNKTKKRKSFLVFRFENPKCFVDEELLNKYKFCKQKHEKSLDNKKKRFLI